MNKKVLATAMVVIGLFPSLLFGQLYRMDVDVQEAGVQKVIDRVFTGNTVGLDVGFYDGGDPLVVTNWTMLFRYYDSQYSTNPPAQIVGVASSNRVSFDSTTNLFYSANENYYFSISGVDSIGRKRTFARGRMIEEYDPGTAGSGGTSSNGIYFISWGNIYGDPASNSNLVDFIEEYAGVDSVARAIAIWASNAASWSSNNFSNVWARGDSVTNAVDATARAGVASNSSAIAILSTGKLDVATAGQIATNVVGAATNALLDLAGTRAMTGNVVTLARDIKSRNAASVGPFGAAFGDGTTAGYAGAAFGSSTKAGNYGFSAGRYANGSTGSFVFADSALVAFNRANSPDSFNVRAAGGTYFDTPLFTVTGEVAAARIALGTNAAVSDWPESGGGITSAEAGTISTNVLAAYTNALPLPGCAILPVDPATSNAWITGAYEFYAITSNISPVNLCISNSVRRIGYSVTMMTTQAVTLATNMVRVGAAWTPTGTNLVVVWPHCDAALWRVKGQAQ